MVQLAFTSNLQDYRNKGNTASPMCCSMASSPFGMSVLG